MFLAGEVSLVPYGKFLNFILCSYLVTEMCKLRNTDPLSVVLLGALNWNRNSRCMAGMVHIARMLCAP